MLYFYSRTDHQILLGESRADVNTRASTRQCAGTDRADAGPPDDHVFQHGTNLTHWFTYILLMVRFILTMPRVGPKFWLIRVSRHRRSELPASSEAFTIENGDEHDVMPASFQLARKRGHWIEVDSYDKHLKLRSC
jgi:hypothetical protein